MRKHDSKPVPSLAIHPTIVRAALSAVAADAEVRAAAEYLAELMLRIHGGNWRVDIDHEARFIMVIDRSEERRITPKPKVA